MTVIASLSGVRYAALASDRLVTCAHPHTRHYLGPHDPEANKLVVLLTPDSFVLIGYCGSAYVEGMATDNWIAATVADDPRLITERGARGMFGGKKPCFRRLHSICNQLRLGLARTPEGRGVAMNIVGFRLHRRRWWPVHLTLNAAHHLGPDPFMRMRMRWPWRVNMIPIGAMFTLQEVAPNISMDAAATDPDYAVAGLTALIRAKAATDPTVGADVMSAVLLPEEKRVRCLFNPSRRHVRTEGTEDGQCSVVVSYTPWVITPTLYHAPIESPAGDGTSCASFEVGDWVFEFSEVTQEPPTPANSFWVRPQVRRPPPGRSVRRDGS
jgi:hypothetical protein